MTDNQKTDVAVVERKAPLVAGGAVAPIIPRTIEEVARIANAVIVAGLAPDSYRAPTQNETASKIMVAIMKGAEAGLAPMMSLANIAIINGKACLYGDGAVALVQASGKVEAWAEHFEGAEGDDGWTAICVIKRRGQSEPYVGRFSYGDAKRAKLVTKGPWVQYPGRMLGWRARTYAMRLGFADCLSGLSIAEEIQDLPPPPVAPAPDLLEDAAEAIAGEATDVAATKPAKAKSEPLRRGLDILSRTAVDDVPDLNETILSELEDPAEIDEWNAACLTKHPA